MRNSRVFILLFGLFLVVFSSCGNSETKNEGEQEEEQTEVQENQDLVSTIQGVTVLSRFTMELGAAEIDLEQKQNSYTFFTPVNGAFGPFYDDTGSGIINISSKELISYHIVPEEYSLSQLEEQLREHSDSLTLSTLQGEHIMITREDDKIILKGKFGGKAEILETMDASNGIVHIIDEMLLPAEIEEEQGDEIQ